MLGGGGLAAVNVYATASEGSTEGPTRNAQALASGAATIDCPDVGSQLTAVPDGARTEVDNELSVLDKQIAEAYQRLQSSEKAIEQDSNFADSSIMNPLKEKRAATIERILIAIDRVGDRPEGLEAFAPCVLRASGNNEDAQGGEQDGEQGEESQAPGDQSQAPGEQSQAPGGGDQGGAQPGNGGQAGNGPVAADFVDIKSVQPNVQNPQGGDNASTGSFATSCGVNANGVFNSDNVIVAPGVTNGAHHFHDYVGNQDNDAFASDEDLAGADTTCENKGDKSSYFWPVLRLQNGADEKDANSPGGAIEGNAGEIITPKQVTMKFVGSPSGDVAEMPKLLRIITGDAKAFVNGPANANASWSCTGLEDRQLKDKYPLCPQGSDVVRTFKFQSCWDGRNIDSANHRTHVAFADAAGNCAGGFKAIPQLVQRIVYDVDAPSIQDGGKTTPLFAVDSFPENLHKPITDHGDFINVFEEDLMKEMVECINGGRNCGAGAGGGGGGGGEEPGDEPDPEPTATETPDAPDDGDNGDNGGNGGDDDGADNGGNNGGDDGADNGGNGGGDDETPDPATSAPQATEPAGGNGGNGGNDNGDDGADNGNDNGDKPTTEPKSDPSPSAAETDAAAGGSGDDVDTAVPGPEPTDANDASAAGESGSLAETGTQLWPAAAGGVLVILGFVLLRRIRAGAE
ncbi:DUF1996 domain-containing protein [Streptomyces fructofermentans]|uniref:DUF1996 domain-containing protein n=1 Tax=Streptomyces fructofermentans TaxID=152141 RepID=UPI0033D7F63E